MVAYSFQACFGPKIEANEKLQTVRADRKRHAYPGECLQLYQGMRTRHCRLIGVRRCLAVHPILIDVPGDLILVGLDYPLPAVETARYGLDGIDYKAVDLDLFSRLDGFVGWGAMKVFWSDEHEIAPGSFFKGVVICWASGASDPVEQSRVPDFDAALTEIGVR